MTAPSAFDWFGTSWSKVGGWLGGGTSVTVQVKVSVASTVAPSRTVTLTLYGLLSAPVAPIVPVIRPVVGLMLSPGGRFATA